MKRIDVPQFVGTYFPLDDSPEEYSSKEFLVAVDNPFIGMVELRADRLTKHQAVSVAKGIKKHIKKPVLGTVRHQSEIGYFFGTEKERWGMYKALIPCVDAVDVEIGFKGVRDKSIALAKKKKQACFSFFPSRSFPSKI